MNMVFYNPNSPSNNSGFPNNSGYPNNSGPNPPNNNHNFNNSVSLSHRQDREEESHYHTLPPYNPNHHIVLPQDVARQLQREIAVRVEIDKREAVPRPDTQG